MQQYQVAVLLVFTHQTGSASPFVWVIVHSPSELLCSTQPFLAYEIGGQPIGITRIVVVGVAVGVHIAEVVAVVVIKPMTWAEFKAYPKDLQKQYLCGLVETYGANLTTLSAMFGASPATIRSFIDENNYGLSFGVGHKMTSKQRELWQKFLSGDEDKTECEVQKAETGSAELAENAPAKHECNLPTMTMTQFSFTFQGKIDVSAIANSILQLIGENGCGKVEIVCTL